MMMIVVEKSSKICDDNMIRRVILSLSYIMYNVIAEIETAS